MQLIIVREARDRGANGEPGLLQYALSTAPLPTVVVDGLRHLWRCHAGDAPGERMGLRTPEEMRWVLPGGWQTDLLATCGPTVFSSESLSLDARAWGGRRRSSWLAIVNGRFAVQVSHRLLGRLLETTPADCLTVTAASDLRVGQERLRLTPDNQVVGYRRLYADSMSVTPIPLDWPHILFLRREAFGAALESGLLSSFGGWVERCRAAGLRFQSVAIAGAAYDLETPEGLLSVAQAALSCLSSSESTREPAPGEDREISPQAHLVGPVVLGREVTIEAGAVVVGPAVLCDGCTVGRDAVVDSAIVGAGVSVEPNRSLGACVVTGLNRRSVSESTEASTGWSPQGHVCPHDHRVFRLWPRFSYARYFKQIADVVAAVLVLILFAPVIPVIALAVKMSSPGPVFFRDKRQGLHGRPFHCVKFRTMRQGADRMQDKLRYVSEVDGPQFKMADDPRITTVGRFLRETYLDEIPQFFNVLCGQMSVVGPRPSPESENTLCPSWRDARLSVRPGITGLWQVRRTRDPQKDFQEWILYDTQYVRDFSFGLDLWICWRTFRRMVANFVSQF
jgi:lipopolysaccharide/colanic/teichoic acid biosynthesis glycosyltransferase/carbonic anhydrase/acetyltransferase-like protein (isoleucine patch superfamily)